MSESQPANRKESYLAKFWRWTGIGSYTDPSGYYHRGKTLWDWMGFLISAMVPIVLAVAGFQFSQNQSSSALLVEQERQREAALQAYLDNMTELILDRGLLDSQPGDMTRAVARSRTLTVLRNLDGGRKGSLVQFLMEARLIDGREPILWMSEANLREADLSHMVDARNNNFMHADLRDANLKYSSLSHFYFNAADLRGADLTEANLFTAELTSANLTEAVLKNAEMGGTILLNTTLLLADLEGTNVSGEQLAKARYLWGATMPDGSRYDGRYQLAGDIQLAQDMGIDVEDTQALALWYAGDSHE